MTGMNRHDPAVYDEALDQLDRVIAAGPFSDSWESLRRWQLPRWFAEGKFGIFIHWGPSSVPGYRSDWYAREMYREGTPEFRHHLANYGPHEEFGFKDFVPRYTMEHFDPLEWASLFRRAGAQFVVPLAEYHDGFAEYDSAFTQFSAVKTGPGRDLLGDLSAALERVGIVHGASTHYAENWWFYHGGTLFPSDVQDPRFSDLYGPAQREETAPHDVFLNHWFARTCDFVDKYRPQLVWFDWWIGHPAFEPYLRRFAAYYYNRGVQWRQEVAINYKFDAMPEGTGVLDIERGQLSDIRLPFWQTDTSMSRNSWIHIDDHDYKPVGTLIGDLVDIVSKNGALLLNIGPRPDGTIRDEERSRLQDIGRFLAVNGEAIYSSRPWRIFGEGPSKVAEGAFSDTHRAPYTSGDVRFTVLPEAQRHEELLYATVLAWPDDRRVVIRSLADGSPLYGEIEKVELLGAGPVTWRREPDGLHVELPDRRPSAHAFSLRGTPRTRRVTRRRTTPTHEMGPSYAGED